MAIIDANYSFTCSLSVISSFRQTHSQTDSCRGMYTCDAASLVLIGMAARELRVQQQQYNTVVVENPLVVKCKYFQVTDIFAPCLWV